MALINQHLPIEHAVVVQSFRSGERVAAMEQKDDRFYVITNEVVYQFIGLMLVPVDLTEIPVGRA